MQYKYIPVFNYIWNLAMKNDDKPQQISKWGDGDI